MDSSLAPKLLQTVNENTKDRVFVNHRVILEVLLTSYYLTMVRSTLVAEKCESN